MGGQEHPRSRSSELGQLRDELLEQQAAQQGQSADWAQRERILQQQEEQALTKAHQLSQELERTIAEFDSLRALAKTTEVAQEAELGGLRQQLNHLNSLHQSATAHVDSLQQQLGALKAELQSSHESSLQQSAQLQDQKHQLELDLEESRSRAQALEKRIEETSFELQSQRSLAQTTKVAHEAEVAGLQARIAEGIPAP